MMRRKPHALKALLLRVGDLLQRFMTALRFAGRGPGFGNLNLVEQANSHESRLLHSAGHCPTPRIRAAKSCPTNTLDGGEAQHANPADQLSTAAGARRSLPLRVHHRCAPGVTRSLARNRGFADSTAGGKMDSNLSRRRPASSPMPVHVRAPITCAICGERVRDVQNGSARIPRGTSWFSEELSPLAVSDTNTLRR